MICVDISNVWGQLSLPDLLAMESEVAAAHETLMEGTGPGAEYRGWLELPARESNPELFRILLAAERIRSDSEVCVVVGMDAGLLGARAAVELLQGQNRNIGKGKGDPQIFFAGSNLSTRCRNELLRLLDGKDFSVIAVSGSETDLEPAIAFRSLRWMLERKYGTDAARKRIYAVTDPEESALRQMAEEETWESFALPAGVRGGFSVLTAAGLLPMAVAGIDISEVMRGAAEAVESYSLRSFENPVWLYAAVRNLLYRGGKAVELLESREPDFLLFGRWWQQLFGEAEGKDGRGLFPVPAESGSLEQRILEGQRNLFETLVRFESPEGSPVIGSDWKDLDGLNYLEGKNLAFVEENACMATVAAHADSGVPVMVMECGELNGKTLGELFFFMELSCGISAYVLGVDPFRYPGAEACRQEVCRMLGKPGCE